MGHSKHKASRRRPGSGQPLAGPAAHNALLSQAIHRSVFAHLTRQLDDPDHPGCQISYAELEQRQRARCYRQARAIEAASGRARMPGSH